MDNPMLPTFLAEVEKLKFRFPVAAISKDTGYGQPAISEFIKGKKFLSEKFLKTFCTTYNIDYSVFESLPKKLISKPIVNNIGLSTLFGENEKKSVDLTEQLKKSEMERNALLEMLQSMHRSMETIASANYKLACTIEGKYMPNTVPVPNQMAG